MRPTSVGVAGRGDGGPSARGDDERSGTRLQIVEYTDPGCPYAFSTEPSRHRLLWLYGDQIDWELRMIAIAPTQPADGDPRRHALGFAALAERYGMPLYLGLRPRVGATLAACRLIVATRLNASEAMRPLLRRIRVRVMSGEMIDSPDTLDAATREVGLDPAAVRSWTREPATEAALAEDLALARDLDPAAAALPSKTSRDGERQRYASPTYAFSAGRTFLAPGMQSSLMYETVIANLAPQLKRRERPGDVIDVLRWSSYPLATQEVAEICGLKREAAREQLLRAGAIPEPAASDAYWSL